MVAQVSPDPTSQNLLHLVVIPLWYGVGVAMPLPALVVVDVRVVVVVAVADG
jgi:hypothetical protein